jgi:hypothetical protein
MFDRLYWDGDEITVRPPRAPPHPPLAPATPAVRRLSPPGAAAPPFWKASGKASLRPWAWVHWETWKGEARRHGAIYIGGLGSRELRDDEGYR